MRIAFIGKFVNFHDEEYIARSFESLRHEVYRIEQSMAVFDIGNYLKKIHPDILIYSKWEEPAEIKPILEVLKRGGMKTVCWLFDLYFDYSRENQVGIRSFFKSDYVFSTDNGHNHRWGDVNHRCVRQGIYKDECVLLPFEQPEYDIVFVGSDSPIYPERSAMVRKLSEEYNLGWFGKRNTNETRGMALNELYAKTKIVVGDSFYSPHYWSNRVVETLGRGGFLIHREVEGLRAEYPYITTYNGTYEDLKEKIDYYLSHEDERREIVRKNFEWVRDNYTMDKKCAELLSHL